LKYRITKSYRGNIELEFGDKNTLLTDKKPCIDLTLQEYEGIPEHKKYLFTNGFLTIEFINDKKVEVKEDKKFIKK